MKYDIVLKFLHDVRMVIQHEKEKIHMEQKNSCYIGYKSYSSPTLSEAIWEGQEQMTEKSAKAAGSPSPRISGGCAA